MSYFGSLYRAIRGEIKTSLIGGAMFLGGLGVASYGGYEFSNLPKYQRSNPLDNVRLINNQLREINSNYLPLASLETISEDSLDSIMHRKASEARRLIRLRRAITESEEYAGEVSINNSRELNTTLIVSGMFSVTASALLLGTVFAKAGDIRKKEN